MASPVILLGAGASIDAGLPDTFRLTELIYDELNKPSYGKQAILFGYVVSKLRARRVLNGGSPFDRVNVEEAYDTLLRVLTKDQDVLSEFASGWDPIFDFIRPEFNENAFMKGIIESVQDQRGSRYDNIISVDQNSLRDAAKAISISINRSDHASNLSHTVSVYMDILVSILSNSSGDTDYIDKLADFVSSSGASVATLNYDILFEESYQRKGFELDYGLSRWNERQLTDWSKSVTKTFKLHGSIAWRGKPDKIEFYDTPPKVDRWRRSNTLMIFGGHNGKLTPEGPFLQLRNDFERTLLKSNRLLIIGYSFSDAHINSIVRKWVTTKNGTKLIIIDPGTVNFGLDVFRNSYDSDAKIKTTEIVHIKKTAANGIEDAIKECRSRFNSKYETGRGGFLPHILVKRIV